MISIKYLALLIIFIHAECIVSKSIDRRQRPDYEDRWLENENNYDVDYLGDSPLETGLYHDDGHDGCPSRPDVHIADACLAKTCKSHDECRNINERCCSNGCVKTCIVQSEPPPFIDWIREPRRRTSSGVSWLVNGPSSGEDKEICSTSPIGKDEDPILCPHGFVCHVIKRGNRKKGIPNIGHCVPENDNDIAIERSEKTLGKDSTSCLVDKYVLLNGAFLFLRGQKCVCKDGYLTCLKSKD